MVFEPRSSEVIGDGQEEVVMVVMLGAEHLQGLVDHARVDGDLLGLGGELLLIVRDHVDGDIGR